MICIECNTRVRHLRTRTVQHGLLWQRDYLCRRCKSLIRTTEELQEISSGLPEQARLQSILDDLPSLSEKSRERLKGELADD